MNLIKNLINNILKNKCYRNLLILYVLILLFPIVQELLNNITESFQSQNEDIQSLREQVEDLRKTYNDKKDELEKCMDSTTIKDTMKRVEEVEKINDNLNKNLTVMTSQQGNSCKQLSDYDIEQHPEFKKRNYHKPCYGCNI